MSQPAHLSSCKRRQPSSPSDISGEHPSKRQKFVYPTRPPPTFWDNLTEIPLTRSALRELDRRNTRYRSSQKVPRRRPITRRAATERSLRHRAIQPATQYLSRSTPAGLKNIKHFARGGGPDLSDLRGYHCEPSMSSSQSSLGHRKRGSASPSKSNTAHQTTSTKSTGPYDRAFQQHLIDYGIYPDGYEYPDGKSLPQPDNTDDILEALKRPRLSLSPSRFSNDDFRKFKRADTHASKEWQVISTVVPIIEGNAEDNKCVSGQVPFMNLSPLTDGSLVPGNPDRYEGARPEQLNRQIRSKLGGYVVPSTQHDLPIAPNFFLAVKGPDGSSAVAGRQACYDGALGARGIQVLRSYGESKPMYDNNTYAITSTYYAGTLKMYTSHSLPPNMLGASPEYVTTQIKAYALTSDADTFRAGAGAYRNARDWAKQQRDETIRKANERVLQESRDTLYNALRLACAPQPLLTSRSRVAVQPGYHNIENDAFKTQPA
ncbi:hypothetical protein F5X99DRAFT_408629 [Biscogniauxia marginata]|nr:hypothetical protein F5X99DRAFT_408629 [Biscogniauxia marginata]